MLQLSEHSLRAVYSSKSSSLFFPSNCHRFHLPWGFIFTMYIVQHLGCLIFLASWYPQLCAVSGLGQKFRVRYIFIGYHIYVYSSNSISPIISNEYLTWEAVLGWSSELRTYLITEYPLALNLLQVFLDCLLLSLSSFTLSYLAHHFLFSLSQLMDILHGYAKTNSYLPPSFFRIHQLLSWCPWMELPWHLFISVCPINPCLSVDIYCSLSHSFPPSS